MTGLVHVGKLILLVGVCACLACDEEQTGTVIAKVGDTKLTQEALSAKIPNPFLGKISAEEKRQLVENWVEEALLYQEARQQKLDEDPQVKDRIDQAVRRLLVAELLERTYAQDNTVLDGEILDYYEANRQNFQREEPEIRVRQILVTDKTILNQVWDRLRGGELFEQVARETSVDVSAESGGDLGYFTEDMVDAPFWEACQDAKLGRRTRVTTKNGFHIIEVLDRREAGSIRDLVDVRAEIQQRILTERRQSQHDALLESIKSRVAWSVDLDKIE